MKAKRTLRLLSFCLIIIISISLFTGCKSRKLSPDSLSKKEVGTVGSYTVYYDELYTVAGLARTSKMSADELWETVGVKLLDSYAKLTLCERYGAEYDEKELEDDVQDYIDAIISESFDGDRGAYLDALEEMGSTDRYMRFNAKVELMYSKLPSAMALKGDLSADEDVVTDYIENNFVRVKHFMVANGKGENADQNLAAAKKALDALRSGKTTMNELIGGKYREDGITLINDDLLIPADGYTFGKGTMSATYENAAYALSVGEFSEVICAKGEDSATGENVDCYYVIERLPLTENIIKDNYGTLYETYKEVVVSEKLTEAKSTLKFVPNEYAKSLNILELEGISVGVDVTLIVIISVSAVAVIGIATAVVLIIVKRKKAGNKAK